MQLRDLLTNNSPLYMSRRFQIADFPTSGARSFTAMEKVVDSAIQPERLKLIKCRGFERRVEFLESIELHVTRFAN